MADGIDGYTLLESVGHDEFGESHLASSRDGSSVVWLSLLNVSSPDQAGSILQKLERAGRLQHSNIVSIVDQGKTSEDGVFQVMELFNGARLKALVDDSGPLLWIPALLIVHEVARAVAYAHENGVYHGRLSSSCILLDESGGVKIRGFGLDHALQGDDGEVALSGTQGHRDIQAIAKLVREMTYDGDTPPESAPALVTELVAWEAAEDPPSISAVLQHVREAVQMAGVADPKVGLERFLEPSSFFFVMNRMFAKDSQGVDVSTGSEASSKSELFEKPQKEVLDLGDLLDFDSKPSLSPSFQDTETAPPREPAPFRRTETGLEALARLEAEEEAEEDKRAKQMDQLVLFGKFVLGALLVVLMARLLFPSDVEERAREELAREFPGFQAEYEGVREPASPVSDASEASADVPVAQSWYQEARAQFDAGNKEEARSVVKGFLSREPLDLDGVIALSNLMLPENPEGAASVVEKFLDRTPEQPLALSVLARVYADHRGAHKKALELVASYMKVMEQDPAFLELLIRIQTERQDPEGVLLALRALVALEGGKSRALGHRLARATEQNQEWHEAHSLYDALVRGDARDKDAFWSLIRVSRKRKALRELVREMITLVKRDPEHTEAQLFLAEYALARRQYDEAERRFGELEKLDPGRWEVAMGRATSAYRQDRLKEAKAGLEALRQVRPGDGHLTYNLGRVVQKQGALKKASSLFLQALTQEPSLWQAQCVLGQVAQRRGKYAEAKDRYKKALAIVGKHTWLKEALPLDLNSSKGEDLAGRPCYHADIFETSAHGRERTKFGVSAARFKGSKSEFFYPVSTKD